MFVDKLTHHKSPNNQALTVPMWCLEICPCGKGHEFERKILLNQMLVMHLSCLSWIQDKYGTYMLRSFPQNKI